MRLRRRPFVTLLAILLVALNALWPLLAQARPRTPGILVPLCTIDGVTHYTELPAPKSPLEQRSDAGHEHCKMCMFGAERLALSSSPACPPDASVAQGPSERALQPVLRSSSSASPAHPRAPPASS